MREHVLFKKLHVYASTCVVRTNTPDSPKLAAPFYTSGSMMQQWQTQHLLSTHFKGFESKCSWTRWNQVYARPTRKNFDQTNQTEVVIATCQCHNLSVFLHQQVPAFSLNMRQNSATQMWMLIFFPPLGSGRSTTTGLPRCMTPFDFSLTDDTFLGLRVDFVSWMSAFPRTWKQAVNNWGKTTPGWYEWNLIRICHQQRANSPSPLLHSCLLYHQS